jgi:multiple sugar transport system permease protein
LKRTWLFIVPALVIMAFNALFPFFYDIYLSLNKYFLLTPQITFVGIYNFRKMVNDPSFISSLLRGSLFAFLTLAIEIPLGLALALFLSREFKGRGILRTIFCIPLAIPPISIGILWLLLTSEFGGPLPYIFRSFLHLNFDMTVPLHAFITTIIMDVWHWTPFVALVLTAGVATIPREIFEAASVDGASFKAAVRNIVLPMLRFPLLVVLLIRLMDLLRIYDEVWMLTGGGPARTTEFLSLYIVRTLTAEYNMGYGAALSLFFIYLIIVLTWVFLQILQRGE